MMHTAVLGRSGSFERRIGVSVEQRKWARYPIHVPVMFQWVTHNGEKRQGAGFTRDVSARGVFVFCPTSPAVTDTASLEVLLPPREAAARFLRLHAGVQVVRLEDSGTWKGFAATGKVGLLKKAPRSD